MCAFWSKLLNVPTEPSPEPFREPIFLIGLMRSGTTMLSNILSEHPQLLKVGFELNGVWTKIGGAPCSVNCSERTEEHFKQEYANNMTAYFSNYVAESKRPIRHLARWSAKRFYGSGRIFYDWDKLYLLNKSPHLSNKVRYLNAMFPNAKYIVLLRDIYAQSASQKMHFKNINQLKGISYGLPNEESECWNVIQANESIKSNSIYPDNFELIPRAWIRLNKKIMEHLEHLDDSKYLKLSYEDYLNDTELNLQKIYNFLGLDDSKVKHKSGQRKIHSTSTSGDPLKKWEKYLTDDEKITVKKVIDENSADYNYIYSKFNS